MTRVLITGGAGFFGSRAALYFKDAELHLVDRVEASWKRVDELRVVAKRHEANLLDRNATMSMLGRVRPDVIVHLAWHAAPATYLTSEENFAHANAATALFLCARDLGCKRFVGAGTCLEYDTSIGVLREDSPARPVNVYSATKYATYLMLESATKQARVSFAWMRFFYPYGPHEAPGRLVSSALANLFAGRPVKITPGEQLRDFIHIDDVARAIAAVAQSDVHGVVNIGSGVAVPVKDAVLQLAEMAGRPDLVKVAALPYRAGDAMHVQADMARLRALGVAPRFSLKEGLRDTLEWARSRLAEGDRGNSVSRWFRGLFAAARPSVPPPVWVRLMSPHAIPAILQIESVEYPSKHRRTFKTVTSNGACLLSWTRGAKRITWTVRDPSTSSEGHLDLSEEDAIHGRPIDMSLTEPGISEP